MPNQIRLVLDPKSDGTTGKPPLVTALSIRFRSFGSGSSAALKSSPQPAQIELFSRFVDAARQTQSDAGTSIGKLPGQLSLQSGRVLFQCDPAAIAKLNDDFQQAVDDSLQQNDPGPSRALILALESPDFSGLDPLAPAPRLLLPADPADHSHIEVLAELSIAGQVEAASEQNDVLDVPLRVGVDFPVPPQ